MFQDYYTFDIFNDEDELVDSVTFKAFSALEATRLVDEKLLPGQYCLLVDVEPAI